MAKTYSDLINAYKKIEEIVAQNPDVTAEEFGKELKNNGIDVNSTTLECFTLLHLAIYKSYKFNNEPNNKKNVLTIIKLLLNNGADINICYKGKKDETFESPISLVIDASLKGHTDLLKVFIENKAVNNEVMREVLLLVKSILFAHEEATHRQAVITLLESALKDAPNVEGNSIEPISSNGSTGSKPVTPIGVSDAINPTVESVVTPAKKTDANLLITIPGDNDSKPAILEPSEHTEVSTKANKRFMKSQKPVADSFISEQFVPPNAGVKYKENNKDFFIQLVIGCIGVIFTLSLATATIFIPLPGNIVLGFLAACVAAGTLIHVVNSTWPSYKEMKENKVECIGASNKQQGLYN
ncbi:ankyrin repeat domain-containing protein [Wolbachia endosymbiont of Folsomia candida]|uniref:ankyrin repeat domain-containing protein n=1 Tax=Wolbachia endosymbiont of Folsomia candida TaxID=169402 RepID=UPI000B2BD089|nr:ankyrin repeat domain-containing protein [Wolbachia endosymbiont of Folsomia candida]APR98804.1 hypothetical protein ASM33_06270 [Wolbachia endosymbiont of Folsomia candida]